MPEYNRPELRETIYRSYRIIYQLRMDPPMIQIVRFWHAARGFPQVPST